MKKHKDKQYPVWTVRLEKEMVEWLKRENEEYKTWNKFFKELKKRYEEKRK